jgi:hypothetical protein
MKRLGMLGIIGGAAILTAVPLSLQWSQKSVMLSLDTTARASACEFCASQSQTWMRGLYQIPR